MFNSRLLAVALAVFVSPLASCGLAPETVDWAPVGTVEGVVSLAPVEGELVALSWILSVRGVVDTTVTEVPFEARRRLVGVSLPDRTNGGLVRFPIVESPPNEAFLPVAPEGVVELGDGVGEIAFGSLAVVEYSGAPQAFAWSAVDRDEADLLMEVRDYLVVWWDGDPITQDGQWYSTLKRGPNLLKVDEINPEENDGEWASLTLVPFDGRVTIREAEEHVGYDACGNTTVDQVVIDATMSEYTYPEDEAGAWCSLYGTTLTHLVCDEIADALCVYCRVEVTTLAYGGEVLDGMEWYCDEVLSGAVGSTCEPDEFMGEDFAEAPRQCVRGELYACEDGTVEYLGDTGCADCSDECDGAEGDDGE